MAVKRLTQVSNEDGELVKSAGCYKQPYMRVRVAENGSLILPDTAVYEEEEKSNPMLDEFDPNEDISANTLKDLLPLLRKIEKVGGWLACAQ